MEGHIKNISKNEIRWKKKLLHEDRRNCFARVFLAAAAAAEGCAALL